MRDEFPNKIKKIVAQRSGYHCSNPSCNRPTSGPQEQPDQTINVGVAAHITAASPGGPRYNPTLTMDERKSVNNAIWLCQNCASLIDRDTLRFDEESLRIWKDWAEETAKNSLEQTTPFDNSYKTHNFLLFLDSLITFVIEFQTPRRDLDIYDYLPWIDNQSEASISPELERIIDYIEINPSVGENILSSVARKIHSSTIMTDRIELLLEGLVSEEDTDKEKHRLMVSARLLEIASKEFVGSGMYSRFIPKIDNVSEGTLSFRWRLGTISPEMMLVELIGGVLENRISIILNRNGSIRLRSLDPLGHEISIVSKSHSPYAVLVITVVWNEKSISLWIDKQLINTRKLKLKFDGKWSLLLAGIDIEGKISADFGQVGYEIDGIRGLNLGRNGIWEGARLTDIAFWNLPFVPGEIHDLAETSKEEVEKLKYQSFRKR